MEKGSLHNTGGDNLYPLWYWEERLPCKVNRNIERHVAHTLASSGEGGRGGGRGGFRFN